MIRIDKKLFFCFAIALAIVAMSCDSKKFKFGVSAKENYDSLFLGLYLGMDQKAFFDRCFELNSQKIATNGRSVQSVLYVMEDELDHRVNMQFYPVFYKDKIIEMPVVFTFEGWAPWNKEFSSDSLLAQLLPVFEKWYGEGFKELDHEVMKKVYVKMDGKRRINLFIRDDQYVQAVFSDMELLRERKKEEKEASGDKE